MSLYIFQCGNEFVNVKVGEDRKLFIVSKITGHDKYVRLTEKLFTDREKKNKFRIMERKIPKLSENEFKIYIVVEFAKMSYKLVSKNE